MSDTSFYVLFQNHTQGMELYHYLKGKGLGVRISPAPRAAKTCCGMSLLVEPEQIEAVRKSISESGIEIERIIELEKQINPQRDKYC